MDFCRQKLLFVLGKGGVGRSAIAAALGKCFAARGERVLVVQWALHDAVSGYFGKSTCGHRAQLLQTNLWTMNFSADEAIREYVVGHLKMEAIHKLVVENRHVQKLIHAVPGLQELFFLGRLFWLVKLCAAERGWSYDRIIVDTPATGHGISLFSLPRSIARMGIAGPLAYECQRVTQMLEESNEVAAMVVTLPEELPVAETLELLPSLRRVFGRDPIKVILNRSFRGVFAETAAEGQCPAWLQPVCRDLENKENCSHLESVWQMLRNRIDFEDLLAEGLREFNLPHVSIPDVHLLYPQASPEKVISVIEERLWLGGPGVDSPEAESN